MDQKSVSPRKFVPPRIIFLIASHLNVPLRIESLRITLASIAKNTVKPDHVYLSYSSDLDGKEYDRETIEEKWRSVLSTIPFTVVFQSQKTHQFEHYFNLLPFVLDTDIVAFSNDDDLVSKDKVEKIRDMFCNEMDGFIHRRSHFGHFELELIDFPRDVVVCEGWEYFCLVLKGNLVRRWFLERHLFTEQTFKDLITTLKGQTDLAFLYQIREINKIIEIDDVLVYQRKGSVLPRAWWSAPTK